MVKFGSMPVETVKQRAIEALQGLPDDATFEDAIERPLLPCEN
jgi:hypothetical protein